MIYCILLNKEISEGYCFELCNIATDILLNDDKIEDWGKAYEKCIECGVYND
jgi:hypothetical protein